MRFGHNAGREEEIKADFDANQTIGDSQDVQTLQGVLPISHTPSCAHGRQTMSAKCESKCVFHNCIFQPQRLSEAAFPVTTHR